MKTIWKFELQVIDEQALVMPEGSRVLCVQIQGVRPCLWALVSPRNKNVTRKFLTIGTGHPIEGSTGEYIGTYQLHDVALVFHVFEEATR